MSKSVREILAKLISFPVLGGQSNTSILNWIKEYLEAHGVAYHLVPHPTEAKASIHCRIGPAVDNGVVLSGHMDVVPVDGQEWDTDPFVLTEKGDKLYARGSCDMKGFVACCLAALPDMLAADLQYPIYFAFSYDEEIGCLAGPALAADINKTYSEKPKYAIIGEPTLMQPVVGQKGICIYEVSVNGSAGHSSRIRQEVSAIHETARLILWLENKMNTLVEAGSIDERFTPPHSSIHIGTVHGGIAPNVIADVCNFHWDVRTIPRDDIQDIRAAFGDYCKEREEELRKTFPGFEIKIAEHHPPVPVLNTPADQSVVDFVRLLCGNHELDAVSYASEAGQFANEGFETVICGPGSIAQAHRANEFVAIEQLEKGMVFMERLIKKLST